MFLKRSMSSLDITLCKLVGLGEEEGSGGVRGLLRGLLTRAITLRLQTDSCPQLTTRASFPVAAQGQFRFVTEESKGRGGRPVIGLYSVHPGYVYVSMCPCTW